MIKISPFTPLFFSPSSDKFGAESRYIQLFAPTDNIFIEVITTTEYKMNGLLKNHVDGTSREIEFQSFSLKDGSTVFHSTITGLAPGYYSISVGDQECNVFKVTDDEHELDKTTLIRYSMRSNKQRNDCIFWNGEEQFYFEFRAPGGFKDDDWSFAVNNEQFEISNGNIVELFAVESTQKKFTLGNAEGCPVWFAEHLNRILCCSNVYFNGVRFVRKGNSVPEMTQEIVSLKSYIFKVSLQGMVDNIDVDFPEGGEEEGGETGGGGEGYVYLIKLNDTVVPTDRNTFSALRILAEIDKAIKANNEGLGDKFISKKNDDYAEGIITFLKDIIVKGPIKALSKLTVGESIIDSLIAGKGIIAENGRIQADRMELRSSLTVLRLIINEIQAMAGDFSFSDCGAIEKVELLDDGTYRLTMEKRTDTDWTTLEENDVLCSIVNSLLIGGTDYYTSWFRPVSKNRNDNTLTVVLYPDSEVPGGKNYPPVEGYNVTRKGNAKVPDAGEAPNERAQSWLLSSREGRIMFLQNVFKPILEDYNYALTLGRFPNVKMIEKLPIGSTDVGVMAKIGVFEKIYEADWNGTIIPKKVDRGEWSLETAQGDEPYRFVDYETLLENQKVITTLEQHTVYHYGCKWGCLIDKTIEEPQWNSAGWVLLEGDKNYHLEFTSTAGWQFFKNGVNTDIAAVVSYGNRDITNVLMATTGVEVEWLRDTGNIPADNSWKPVYVDGQKHVIRLTSVDMGSEWGLSVRTVKFICRVFIPVGEDMETVENYVGFRI
ncbi:hypothetical protein [Bacteroides intestinalis]|uniref:hypothetical protein n=1 Tax=Bacteroides intestinalis TaxID=329854 RepID=UPI0018A0CE20|nr:hypothetical protein [Bacteroides intestinalis]